MPIFSQVNSHHHHPIITFSASHHHYWLTLYEAKPWVSVAALHHSHGRNVEFCIVRITPHYILRILLYILILVFYITCKVRLKQIQQEIRFCHLK